MANKWNFDDPEVDWNVSDSEIKDEYLANMQEAEQFLEVAQGQVAQEDTITVIDAVFDFIDQAMQEDETQVDQLLNELDLGELTTSVLVGIATATHPAKSQLKERESFLDEAERIIRNRGEWEEGLFDGFRTNDPIIPMDMFEKMKAADEITRGQFTEESAAYSYNIHIRKRDSSGQPRNVLRVPIRFTSKYYDLALALKNWKDTKGASITEKSTIFYIEDKNEPERSAVFNFTT